ncbi:unnamed protein product [Kuraishia capsulata CBS 1993]|uniref:Uncharacterized protein n=1 Tax=Kuraishia capsulata CBS 1993 TaxID=1382522 RepID=W6MTN0_9ASCO|nr:uncharacterized protein KUCA_T00005817001 [Kuraishia capsulata CBS 1993]CDK29823.1 unnamed protein product [Kuraishia capsulata CBS 1993]
MISATAWVPRGFPSEFPEKYELNDEEMARIEAMSELHLGDARATLEEAQGAEEGIQSQLEIDDDLREYDLEHYDDDESADIDPDSGEALSMFPGLANNSRAKMHTGEDGQAHVSLGDANNEDEDDDDIELAEEDEEERQMEKADLQVLPTDNMVLAAKTEDDVSYLEVYVYDDGADENTHGVAPGHVREASLYVHHDLMLPAFPLCVEWVNFKPREAADSENIGNFAAIGTFDPTIEIWNLDSIDKAFPDVILGETDESTGVLSKKKKKTKKNAKHVTTHHTDAVLSLAHNKAYRSVLASTSADSTVKLWDLNQCVAAKSVAGLHGGKHVSSSTWVPEEGSVLLTGGYDGFAALSDVRIEGDSGVKRWGVNGEDVETVTWARDSQFYVGTDHGNVYCFDARGEDKPVWTLHAHDSGITSLQSNSAVSGMILTSAMSDKAAKLWKVQGNKPSMILSRDFGVGNVLTASFAPDLEVAGNVVIGGATAQGLTMWDVFSNRSVRAAFKEPLAELQALAADKASQSGSKSRLASKYRGDFDEVVVVVGQDDEDDDDEE